MKKTVLACVILIITSFLGSAQETKKDCRYVVQQKSEKTTIYKNGKPATVTKKTNSGSSGTSQPAWKTQQEENRRRLGLLESGQTEIKNDLNEVKDDVSDLKRGQYKQEIRLDIIEQKVDYLTGNLTPAQLLQQSVNNRTDNNPTENHCCTNKNDQRNKKIVKGVVWGFIGGAVATAIVCIVKNSINRNAQQPYQPPAPTPAPNPTPAPATGTGSAATVPVIP